MLFLLISIVIASQPCPEGLLRSEWTAGQCCHPGQVWLHTLERCAPEYPCPHDYEESEAPSSSSPTPCQLPADTPSSGLLLMMGKGLSEHASYREMPRVKRECLALSLSLLDQALTDPNQSAMWSVHYTRGKTLSKLKRPAQAHAAFNAALTTGVPDQQKKDLIWERFSQTKGALSQVEHTSAQGKEADVELWMNTLLADGDALLELMEGPRAQEISLLLGRLAWRMGRFDEAVQRLMETAARAPDTRHGVNAAKQAAHAEVGKPFPDPDPPTIRGARLKPWATESHTLTTTLLVYLGKENQNMVVSPWAAIQSAGVALLGAKGETATQLRTTLALPADIDLYKGVVSLNSLMDDRTFRLSIEMVVDTHQTLQEDFLGAAASHYGVVPKSVPLRNEPYQWKTCSKLPVEVPKGSAFAIAACAELDVHWKYSFQKDKTIEGTFHPLERPDITVPFMTDIRLVSWGQFNQFQALRLAYQDSISLVVLLPDTNTGLPAMLTSLQNIPLESVLEGMVPTKVDLQLPRFSIHSEANLSPLFQVKTPLPFDCRPIVGADFSAMLVPTTIQNPLQTGVCLSMLTQNAQIELDETGTRARMVSMLGGRPVVLGISAPPPPPVPFHVDHPFAWLIVEDHSGIILFAGQVVTPE